MNKMTLKQIFDKFYTLKTSSDKLVYIDELKTLTKNKLLTLISTSRILKNQL